MLFQAENYVCYIIYDARSLEANQVGRNISRSTMTAGSRSSSAVDTNLKNTWKSKKVNSE